MKKLFFLFLTVFVLLCGACSDRSGADQPTETGADQPDETGADRSAETGADQPDETEEQEWYYVRESIGMGQTRTYSDLGVLRDRGQGEHYGVCYFFDPVSGREVPMCAKTNCTHQGYGGGNPNPDCDAWLGTFINCAAIIGDSLYYVVADDNDFFRQKICRADPDGTNRKVLEVMDDVTRIRPGMFYQDGYLIYEYFTDTARDGTPLEKSRSGICVYDLERNEAEYISVPENYSSIAAEAMVADHCLYYLYCYTTEDYSKISYEDLSDEKNEEYLDTISRAEIWAYDLDTKEKRLLLQEGGRNSYYLGFGYAYVDGKSGARLIDLRTGESRELEDPERFQYRFKSLIEEGVLFCGDGSIDLCEFETGEVKHIGSYDRNLSISIRYVGRDWVYGELYNGGPGEIFYLPKEQFMKGDFEWEYLPREES